MLGHATTARLVQGPIVLLSVQVLDVAIVPRVLLYLLNNVNIAKTVVITYRAYCTVARDAIAPSTAAGLVGTNVLLGYVEVAVLGCRHLLNLVRSAARASATVRLHLVDAGA